MTIDQLTFGARNQSTNATKLPVKLGVALLKDRNGRIALDLPVSGSLDDPSFQIGGAGVESGHQPPGQGGRLHRSPCWGRWWAAARNCNTWISIRGWRD